MSTRVFGTLQLVGGLLCIPPVVWSAHFYVAHQSDEVAIWKWVVQGLIVAVLWGPFQILAGATLTLSGRGGRVGAWLGLVGGIQATILYCAGVWVFTFRYPPHWTLYAMEVVAALGAVLALLVSVAQLWRSSGRAAQQGVAADEAR
jgi:hypothetical protein